MSEPLKASSPSDTRDPEHTLDGFDTRDIAPEPGDEDLAARKPKKRKPRKTPKKAS